MRLLGGLTVTFLALGSLAGCTTTNPPYDAGEDVNSPDGACDPGDCASGTCLDGRCAPPCGDGGACERGEACCEDGFCTDLETDPDHCGACEITCGPEGACVDGTCTDVTAVARRHLGGPSTKLAK